MAESQLALDDNREKHLDILVEQIPEVAQAVGGVLSTVYRDGALDTKTKRLMAMSIALGAGCRNCILAQTRLALEAGATKTEVFEAISVVIAMRGTTGIAESLRVIQLLDEKDQL
jgi:AhpD family alkylhydroperoxidase